MSKRDDISATEKLLEIIRSDTAPPPAAPRGPDPAASSPAIDLRLELEERENEEAGPEAKEIEPEASVAAPAVIRQPVPAESRDPRPPRPQIARPKPRLTFPAFRRPPSVGVEIRADSLSFVKVTGSAPQAKIADYRSVTLARAIPQPLSFVALQKEEWLREKLRATLDDFCPHGKHLFWAAIPRHAVTIHNVQIPTVPKKELRNAVYWTLKKETSFEEQAVILDFVLLGPVKVGNVEKTMVMAYLAKRQEVEAMERLFRAAGHPLKGVTLEPAAIQNLYRQQLLPTAGPATSHLVIGEQDTDRVRHVRGKPNNLRRLGELSAGTCLHRAVVNQRNLGPVQIVENIALVAADDHGGVLDRREYGCQTGPQFAIVVYRVHAVSGKPSLKRIGRIAVDQSVLDVELRDQVQGVGAFEAYADEPSGRCDDLFR